MQTYLRVFKILIFAAALADRIWPAAGRRPRLLTKRGILTRLLRKLV
ncbi:MAG: hypothetical protein JWN30_2863 [Bacilli bacterium]|nr:hypothetical protein [Bacilli bacterium]